MKETSNVKHWRVGYILIISHKDVTFFIQRTNSSAAVGQSKELEFGREKAEAVIFLKKGFPAFRDGRNHQTFSKTPKPMTPFEFEV